MIQVAILLTLVLLSAWPWSIAIRRMRSGEPILPFRPRRPVSWGLIDLIILVGLFVVFGVIGQALFRRQIGNGLPGSGQTFNLKVTPVDAKATSQRTNPDDGQGNSEAGQTLNSTVPDVDDTAPSMLTNTGSKVNKGGTATLARGELEYIDRDQPASSVNYTVTAGLANGHLELTTETGNAVTSFTQDDINNNRLVYVHDGSSTSSDSFTFNVDDGQGNSVSATPAQRVWFMGVSSGVTLLAVMVSLFIVLIRNGFDWKRVGWNPSETAEDIKLGLVVFLALAGPILAIQTAMVVIGGKPSAHPIIEMIKSSDFALPICAISAVIIAPLCEEYFFRGLLQGWMQKLVWHEMDAHELVFGTARPDSQEDEGAEKPPAKTELMEETKDKSMLAPIPIVMSALIFALMHYSHGPDWIALFFFAMGLGYVFQRTHRIVPCIMVHLLLNSYSMLVLLIGRIFGFPEAM